VVKSLGVLDNVKFVNRLAFLIGALSVFIVFVSIVIYVLQNGFKIEHITIKGNTAHITREQLSYIAKNRLRGTFFTLDIDNLQREFTEIPWVQSVTVTRDFPDAITVNINEYQAIARLGDEGLISLNGRIFSGADDRTTLPVFNGLSTQVPQFITNYAILKPLLSANNISLTRLDLSVSGISRVFFSNNLEVVICNFDISATVKKLSKYWNKLYQLNPDLTYVNMCYKNAVAINSSKNIKPPAAAIKPNIAKKGKSQ
jgi:cell division protein FtsQ